jgi:hypothetical protein
VFDLPMRAAVVLPAGLSLVALAWIHSVARGEVTSAVTVEQPVKQKTGLNRSIADQGWFEIRRQLGYKTARHGGTLVPVPAPGSSQTCANCAVRDPESRQGCGRLFACVHCGHSEHADRNAALTILERALSTAGRKHAHRREAGPAASGRRRPQSTRSPQRGRGAHPGSRMREPSPRSPHHDQEGLRPSGACCPIGAMPPNGRVVPPKIRSIGCSWSSRQLSRQPSAPETGDHIARAGARSASASLSRRWCACRIDQL